MNRREFVKLLAGAVASTAVAARSVAGLEDLAVALVRPAPPFSLRLFDPWGAWIEDLGAITTTAEDWVVEASRVINTRRVSFPQATRRVTVDGIGVYLDDRLLIRVATAATHPLQPGDQIALPPQALEFRMVVA